MRFRNGRDATRLGKAVQRRMQARMRQVASQLHFYRNTRNVARMLRQKIMAMAGRHG